jgi:hypothetical protein
VSPLPIPHLHDWRKMEVCLINFNKGKDDEGCLKFCHIYEINIVEKYIMLQFSDKDSFLE